MRLLSATLFACLLPACTADVADDCQPGDIDCAEAGGKEDGWDDANDPSRLAKKLNYRLAELPKSGKLTTPVWKDEHPAAAALPVAWTDTYWPTYDGSHNARWAGADAPSPLEKYDRAFNDAAGCATHPAAITGPGSRDAWADYYRCAGPAARWQSKEYQNGGDMHDGVDNDGDGVTDDRGSSGDVDGIATWWGTCHAWAPASLMVPEPQHAVTVNGVTFEVGDIKALIQNTWDSTAAVMIGGRCNAQEIMVGPKTSANDECANLNPGAVHVVVTNFIGREQRPLVEDRSANFEVWNQPVIGYEITRQDKVTESVAMQCVGGTGSEYTYNTNAAALYDVKMTLTYLTEGNASAEPLGIAGYERTDRLHYILEVSSTGKVIGGRYCTDSVSSHPDFFWTPTGNHSPSNPYVKNDKVRELLEASIR